MESALIAVIGVVASLAGALLAALTHRRELAAAKKQLLTEVAKSTDRQAEATVLGGLLVRQARVETVHDTEEVKTRPEFDWPTKRRSLDVSTTTVEELRQIFRDELVEYGKAQRDDDRKAERRTLLLGFLQNVLFFGLGVGATVLISG